MRVALEVSATPAVLTLVSSAQEAEVELEDLPRADLHLSSWPKVYLRLVPPVLS